MSAPATGELTGAVCDLCRTDRFAEPVPEAGDYEYGVPGRWGLTRCTSCHLYYQAPRPDAAEIPAFYPTSELLKPADTLFGETPKIDCWDFRLFGRYWGALHVPRHIALFSPEITSARERVGLRDVRIVPLRTVGWSAGIQNWLADRAGRRVSENGRVRWYPLLIAAFLPVTVLQALLSRTATMAFVARKLAR